MTYQGQVELWDAINALVVASGGKSNTSVARQKAVAAVEHAVAVVVEAAIVKDLTEKEEANRG